MASLTVLWWECFTSRQHNADFRGLVIVKKPSEKRFRRCRWLIMARCFRTWRGIQSNFCQASSLHKHRVDKRLCVRIMVIIVPHLSKWKRPRSCSTRECFPHTAGICRCLPVKICCSNNVFFHNYHHFHQPYQAWQNVTLVRKSSSVWTVSMSTRRFILWRQSIGLIVIKTLKLEMHQTGLIYKEKDKYKRGVIKNRI